MLHADVFSSISLIRDSVGSCYATEVGTEKNVNIFIIFGCIYMYRRLN